MTTKEKKTAKAAKVKPNPKGTLVTKEFTFEVMGQEWETKARAVGALENDISALETKFDEIKKDWKAKIDTRAGKRTELLNILHAGKETRTIEAVLVKNFDSKEIEYWFEGRIIERRTMTAAELQMDMSLDKVAAKARGIRQSIEKGKLKAVPAIVDGDGQEIADVVKQETNKRTKLSSVDGPSTA